MELIGIILWSKESLLEKKRHMLTVEYLLITFLSESFPSYLQHSASSYNRAMIAMTLNYHFNPSLAQFLESFYTVTIVTWSYHTNIVKCWLLCSYNVYQDRRKIKHIAFLVSHWTINITGFDGTIIVREIYQIYQIKVAEITDIMQFLMLVIYCFSLV